MLLISASKYTRYILVLFFLIMLLRLQTVSAQDAPLQHQLEQSRYLTYIMQPDSADMGMTRWLQKKVEQSRVLPLAEDINSLQIKGPGTIRQQHKNCIRQRQHFTGNAHLACHKKSFQQKLCRCRSNTPAARRRPAQIQPVFSMGICRCARLLLGICRLYAIQRGQTYYACAGQV